MFALHAAWCMGNFFSGELQTNICSKQREQMSSIAQQEY